MVRISRGEFVKIIPHTVRGKPLQVSKLALRLSVQRIGVLNNLERSALYDEVLLTDFAQD